ncbi:MAG TPA: TonB-dependent receptor, partial [Thermoanaerobaculia bacterium]|nr:TonB-dependent receptor [Thermoanaerobaculia bacterium]
MQGTRTAVTGEGGGYNFGSIPPGEYSVRFELEGMTPVTKRVQIGVGQSGRADAALSVSSVSEAITVTAASPSVLETPSVSTNLSARTVEELPTLRDPVSIALLAPGVNSNTFANDQLSISGGPGYDNLVMVNGVAITEAVRSQMIDLFIEDAIQETTVMTGGISAEYGRFTGGVVNTITKSGGNEFSGSFRDNLTNPAWVDETPTQTTENPDTLNEVYEATLGGYILRDRLWFFGAGRDSEQTFVRVQRPVPGSTGSPSMNELQAERRLEGKLTGQITARHNLSASYLDVEATAENARFTAVSYDLEQFSNRSDPQTLLSAFYNGVLTNNWMVEARYSEMEWGVANGSGSQFTDLIRGTIVRNRADSNARYNSATFCGVCDKETRSNDNLLLKTNYYLSTRSLGNHNLVAGFDSFSEHRFANNYQSGSNFRVFVDSAFKQGDTIYPRITAGRTIFQWTPIFALQQNETDLQTDSVFVNDRWDLNDNWSFSAGLRYDQNDAIDASGNKISDDSKISPRLNATFDPLGNGRHRFSLSYGEYASRIVEGPGTGGASAGNPGSIYFTYDGPAINPEGTPDSELLTTHQALEQIFGWLNSQCNAQGQCGTDNLSIVRTAAGPLGGTNSVPGYDIRIADELASPYMREIAFGYGLQIASNAIARVDLISRDWRDFYAYRVDNSTPKEADFLGIPHDIAIVENSNDIQREYRGVQFQTNWRPRRFNVGLNYTWSELKGNDEQENAVSGTIGNYPSSIYYPEISNFAQNLPVGYLAADQRHRVRAWVGYDVPLPAILGALNVSVLQNYDTGTPYGAVQLIELTPYEDQILANTNYTAANLFPQYYFTDRDEYRTPNITSTNFALNYRYPIGRLEIFAQGELMNAFDEENFTVPNVAVSTWATSSNARLAPFNPFTETPIECQADSPAGSCHWFKGASFGQAASATAANWQLQRTYRFSVGVRF